jgi:hypothetical protein
MRLITVVLGSAYVTSDIRVSSYVFIVFSFLGYFVSLLQLHVGNEELKYTKPNVPIKSEAMWK